MKYFNIRKVGLGTSYFHDLYYRTLKASWTKFFIVAALVYLLLNLLFACFYYLSSAQIANVSMNSLWDLFIFSFQTSTTIGYGYFLPQSDAAHVLVILDALSGIFYAAIITGLAFSKFARPNAKILFSDKVLFTTFDGQPAIMMRLANGRDNRIVDAEIKVSALIPYTSQEGLKMRRFIKLNLLNDSNPVFSLSWTAIHIMGDDCPLKNWTLEEIKEKDVFFTVSFTGIDDVLSQTVHANTIFSKSSFVEGRKFKDILMHEQGKFTLDMSDFNEVEA